MPTNGLTFNNIPDSITQRALSHNYSLKEKSRREQMLLNIDFFYGKQEQQLKIVNDDVDPSIINLTRPIIKKRATLLYRKKVLREYKGPAASIAFLEQVYKDNKIDRLMLSADLSAELTGSTLIHATTTDDLPSGIKLLLFDSSQVSVIQDEDDPQQLEALSLVKEVTRLTRASTAQSPQVETVLKQQVWTKDSVVTYNGYVNGSSTANELMLSETNELGFIPFVNIRGEQVHDQYLGHAPTTILRKLNEVVNQNLTHLNHIIKMQGFTPIALSGYQSGEGVVIHPGRAFSLPAGAAAQVLSTNPKIQEILQVLQYIEEKAFETSSVPKVTVIGGEGESGRELLVRFFPLLQVFEDKAVMYQDNELELANLILKLVGMPEIEQIKINYPEDSILPLSADNDTLIQDIELHLKTPIDELMQRDADLTEIEAEAIILANRDFNQSLNKQEPSEEEPEEELDEEGNPINKEDGEEDAELPKDNTDKPSEGNGDKDPTEPK